MPGHTIIESNKKAGIILIILICLVKISVLQGQKLSTYPPYFIKYNQVDSVLMPPQYPDQAQRDSVEGLYDDYFDKIFNTEAFNLRIQNIDFMHRQGSSWIINLNNGKIITLEPEEQYGISHYIFEQYYHQTELIVFRKMQYEGGGYRLIDRNKGASIWSEGPPVFSPDKKFFICLSGDFGYLENGIELYEMTNEGAQKILWHDPGMAPLNAIWLTERKFLVEMLQYGTDVQGLMTRSHQYFEVSIVPTDPD